MNGEFCTFLWLRFSEMHLRLNVLSTAKRSRQDICEFPKDYVRFFAYCLSKIMLESQEKSVKTLSTVLLRKTLSFSGKEELSKGS